jgi:hypothetical protein
LGQGKNARPPFLQIVSLGGTYIKECLYRRLEGFYETLLTFHPVTIAVLLPAKGYIFIFQIAGHTGVGFLSVLSLGGTYIKECLYRRLKGFYETLLTFHPVTIAVLLPAKGYIFIFLSNCKSYRGVGFLSVSSVFGRIVQILVGMAIRGVK